MQTKHVLILAGWLASVGTMVASLPSWSEATTPLFIGGLVGSLATQVIAVYMERPNA
jgi:fructose-specific phosphotransferase system IIC component